MKCKIQKEFERMNYKSNLVAFYSTRWLLCDRICNLIINSNVVNYTKPPVVTKTKI